MGGRNVFAASRAFVALWRGRYVDRRDPFMRPCSRYGGHPNSAEAVRAETIRARKLRRLMVRKKR